MSDAYMMHYNYHGPPLRNAGEFIPERDSRTLREKMKDASSSRALNAAGNLDLLNTCVLIFERAHDLPRVNDKQYVIDISDPQKPRLEIVDEDATLSANYRTKLQILSEKASRELKTKSQKPRRKGWTNNFFYGARAS